MNIFNIDEQLLDILQLGDNLARKPASNVVNILWMLEHSEAPAQKEVNEFYNKLKSKEQYFSKTMTRKIRSDTPVGKTLLDEKIVIKRMEYLVGQGADITKLGNQIVAYKNLSILKKSIELGMDVNYEESGNYPLKKAIQNRGNALFSYLYSLPSVNKRKIDDKNNNVVHFAVSAKSCAILPSLFKEHLDLFYLENHKQESPIDKMFKWKNYSDISENHRKLIEPIIYKILDSHYNGLNILKPSTMNRLISSSVSHVNLSYQQEKIDKLLPEKEVPSKKLKI